MASGSSRLKRKSSAVNTYLFSDSEGEDDLELSLPTTEQMRHESALRVDGRTKHSAKLVDIQASPEKRRPPQRDLLYDDVPNDYDPGEYRGGEEGFIPEGGFTFDDGHPVDKGPRDLRESVCI